MFCAYGKVASRVPSIKLSSLVQIFFSNQNMRLFSRLTPVMINNVSRSQISSSTWYTIVHSNSPYPSTLGPDATSYLRFARSIKKLEKPEINQTFSMVVRTLLSVKQTKFQGNCQKHEFEAHKLQCYKLWIDTYALVAD